MTPQIGCDRRNPAGRLILSSAQRHSSLTSFVASFSFLNQTSNSNGGDHAGFRMPSTTVAVESCFRYPFETTFDSPLILIECTAR